MSQRKFSRPLAALLAAGLMATVLPVASANAVPITASGDADGALTGVSAAIKPQWTYKEQPIAGSPQPATAEPAVDRPDTEPCTVELFNDRQFVPKDGAPPQDWEYTPVADCAGPWSKIVLETDFSSDPDARLYDKTAKIFLNGVNIYFGTTMGAGQYAGDYIPLGQNGPIIAPEWTEEVDLTEYASLFTKPGKGKVHVDNDALQNGDASVNESAVHVTARLVFYPVAEGETAPTVADQTLSLDPDADEGEVVWKDSQKLSYTFDDLPRNLERVYLDVHREGQRSDEFYYLNGTPKNYVREFLVSVDGVPAGVVPAYPYKYTYTNGGGYSYYHWSPVPAVSAMNFTSYRVDLSPFAGVLSDGNPHTVSVNGYGLQDKEPHRDGYVLTGGAFFYLTGSLVLYQDHDSETTSGAVTENTLGSTPEIEEFSDVKRVIATHDSVISGYVDTSHGRVTTTVDNSITFDSNITGVALSSSQPNQQTDIVSKTTVNDNGEISTATVDLSYINQVGPVREDGLNTFGWTYDAQWTVGDKEDWVSISDLYTTKPYDASAELNTARQRYTAFDSNGKCYDRAIDAKIKPRDGSIIGTTDGAACAAVVAPSIELSASADTIAVGETAALTANLSETSATGTVEFLDGDEVIGRAEVADGAAALAVSDLAAGQHAMTARYVPDLAAAGAFKTSEASDRTVITVTDASITAPAEDSLVTANHGTVSSMRLSADKTHLSLMVGTSHAGEEVAVFVYPEATLLGKAVVAEDGTVTVQAPEFVATGTHKFAVTAADGSLIGWTMGAASATEIEAEVLAPATPQDGEFSFIAPVDATVKLTANAELDENGQSVSTGVLGEFSVVDQRAVSKPGWDLSADATEFTKKGDATVTFANKALGIRPQLASGTAVTVTPTTAGSANYATVIAERSIGTFGDTVFSGADLTVKAPVNQPGGTYLSTLTLTLASK